jgi:hypothetical protein
MTKQQFSLREYDFKKIIKIEESFHTKDSMHEAAIYVNLVFGQSVLINHSSCLEKPLLENL